MLALSADLGRDCSRHGFLLQDVGMDTIEEEHESIHRISHFAGMAAMRDAGKASAASGSVTGLTRRARPRVRGRSVHGERGSR